METHQYEYVFVEFAETQDGKWQFVATSGTPVEGILRVTEYSNALGSMGWDMVTTYVIVNPIPQGCLSILFRAPQQYTRRLVIIFKRNLKS